MSLGKPMSDRTKKIVGYTLEKSMDGTCEGIQETEEGTIFSLKISTTKMIFILDR